MFSQAFKDLLGVGVWAENSAGRTSPESVGLSVSAGWPVAYEQRATLSYPERLVVSWFVLSKFFVGGIYRLALLLCAANVYG